MWQCSRTLLLRCGSDVVHLIQRLHKVVVLDAAALALHPTTVLAVVLERRHGSRAGRRDHRAGAIEDRLMTLLALQTSVAAWRRGKHVIRIHRTDQ